MNPARGSFCALRCTPPDHRTYCAPVSCPWVGSARCVRLTCTAQPLTSVWVDWALQKADLVASSRAPFSHQSVCTGRPSSYDGSRAVVIPPRPQLGDPQHRAGRNPRAGVPASHFPCRRAGLSPRTSRLDSPWQRDLPREHAVPKRNKPASRGGRSSFPGASRREVTPCPNRRRHVEVKRPHGRDRRTAYCADFGFGTECPVRGGL
jgi:hypothetical protein